MKKYFIITIDTEGDNLWKVKNDRKSTERVTNKNGEYIVRFQQLCEKYKFIPTYLTNYEMAKSQPFVEMAKEGLKEDKLEIGMHLHAFNSPPFYDLKDYSGGHKAYITEYPSKVIKKKVDYLTKLLQDTFQTDILSHRGGRWSLNEVYAGILQDSGYFVDCTVTPHIDWSRDKGQMAGSHGVDYRSFQEYGYQMSRKNIAKQGKGLWEIPLSVVKKPYKFQIDKITEVKRLWNPELIWLRPDGNNLSDMLHLVKLKGEDKKNDYLEFMLHSSELMPGGSRVSKREKDLEKLYRHIEILFQAISRGYEGIGLTDYAKRLEARKGAGRILV